MTLQSQQSEISLLVAGYKWLALFVNCVYIVTRPPGFALRVAGSAIRVNRILVFNAQLDN